MNCAIVQKYCIKWHSNINIQLQNLLLILLDLTIS